MPKFRLFASIGVFVLLATACTLGTTPSPTPVPERTPDVPVEATATPVPELPWNDVASVMEGVCFEAAFDVRDQVFVFRNTAELTAFFDMLDGLGVCRRAIERGTFDFADGQAIAGLWSYDFGCTAQHTLVDFTREQSPPSISIRLNLEIGGDCPYELLRPFWISLRDAASAEITIEVLR